MIGVPNMWKDKQIRIDNGGNFDDGNLNESVFEHVDIISEKHAHFSVEPSNEKDYDIYLMTGNNGKGSEKK